MNNQLFDFSETPQILYEIAMSIGTSLELKPMAKTCLQVMLKKLNCTAGAIYQFVPSAQEQVMMELTHAIPRRPERNALFRRAHQKASDLLAEAGPKGAIPFYFEEAEEEHFYLFPLPSFGLLLLVKKGVPLKASLRKSIEPLMVKLANSAIACTTDMLYRQREKLLQAVLDTIPEAVFWKDRDSVYLGANRAFAEDAGCESPDVLIGKTDYEFWTEDQADFFVKIDQEVMTADEAQLGFEEPQHQADGNLAWLRTSKVPIHDDNGQVIGILGTYQDITEEKSAQEQLKYQANVLQQISDAVISVDMNFVIQAWNKAAETIYGYAAEEVLGKNISEFVETEYDDLAPGEGLQQLMNEGRFFARATQRVKNGRNLYIFTSSTLLQDDDGNPIGMVAINRDISELVQTEAKLQERENHLDNLIEQMPIGFIEWNLENRVAKWNQAAATIFGHSADDAIGQRADFILAESVKPLVDEIFSQLRSEEGGTHSVNENVRADGNTILCNWHNRPVKNELGEVVSIVSMVDDVTEITEARRQVAAENKRFDLVISNGDIGIWEWNIPDNKVFWSDNVESVLGLEPGTFDGTFEMYQALVHPADAADVDEALTAALEQDEPYTVEHRIVLPSGELGWLAASGTVTRDENGRPLQMLGTVNNITTSKESELQIQRSLERRNRETRLITEIAQSIAGATNLNVLYREIVTLVQEQFGYYHTQLLQYDPALDTMVLTVGYGEVGEQMLAMNHSMPLGVGLIGTAAAQKRPMLRSNVTDDHNWQPNPLLPNTKGELAVPIIMQDKVLGVLDVQSDMVNALDENDQFLLEGLCGQIAIAIESTHLQEEMETQLQELSALQRFLVREGWDNRLAAGDTRQGYLYKRGELLPLNANGENGHGNIIEHPLAVRGEPIGQLGIAFENGQTLSEEDEQFLNAVSRQVAEALESVRLMEQTQTSLYAQEQLSSDLRTVAEVSSTASEALEVETLLQAVVNLSKKRFNLYHAHIFLFDEWQYQLKLMAGSGDIGQLMVLEGQTVEVNDTSVIGRAAKRRDVIVVNDVESVDYFKSHPLLPKTKAEMAVPLLVGESLLGVLDVQANTRNRFDEQDVMIMKTLASQIAVSLQNASLYAEQVETADKLRSVDQLKSEFLASMSHELRTPLNSIIGFADVLLEGFDGPLTDRMEEDVRLIRDSGRHLKSLIGDILDLSKIEAGRMELRYEQVDINQLAKDVIATSMSLAQEKSLYLDLHTDDTITTIPCDQVRIRQVLINIVGNGIKFTEKGGVTVKTVNHEEHLLISIQDTGIGIEQEDIDIVFEQFRQVDGSMTRAAGGTGLGMPISKKLVELHGGDIWIESTVGEGSTFFFTIPHTPSYQPPETGALGL